MVNGPNKFHLNSLLEKKKLMIHFIGLGDKGREIHF